MTTTETMTIRKGLKELKVLNNRISDLRDYNFIQYYKNDNKFIGALTPDQATADIKATMDKLNAMIARREAINRAVMAQNAQSVIKVKKFITFAHIGENHEDDAIAAAKQAADLGIKVYTIGAEQPFSQEICGGPHVQNTSDLGRFRIIKEESSSAGVRRIKAILE